MLATELIRFCGDLRLYLQLNTGMGFAFHLLHADGALQNRRVADQQALGAQDVVKLPMLMPSRSLNSVFLEQQGSWPEDVL